MSESGVHRRHDLRSLASTSSSDYYDPYEMKDFSTSTTTATSGIESDYKHAYELEDLDLDAPLIASPSLPYHNHTQAQGHHRASSLSLSNADMKLEQPPERESTRPGAGWWREQMLVDRTLRVMAATTAVFAVLLLVLCVVLAPGLAGHLRRNPYSTSVVIASGARREMDRRSEALKFFINIAATMVLGMSNTYQQLVTALSIKDIKYMLTKFGDSRVGTNSPFAINHKRDGRARAWCAWLLLVFTSVPVHLLANSLVGVSSFYQTPSRVVHTASTFTTKTSSYSGLGSDFPCWSALRLGRVLSYTGDPSSFANDTQSSCEYADPECKACSAKYYSGQYTATPSTYRTEACKTMTVVYDRVACGGLVGMGGSTDAVVDEWAHGDPSVWGACTYGMFECVLNDEVCEEDDRLVVRMLAAAVLAACLCVKAVYMVGVNLRGRRRLKAHCLTFGDILVAAVMDPALQVRNECMVNGGDFHRRQVAHQCHKHCRAPASLTGEEIGHCQKCKKFNTVDNMTNLAWPALATKRKKSLITNLGQAALTQMLTLSFSSMAMIGTSIVLAITFAQRWAFQVCLGRTTYAAQAVASQIIASFSLRSLFGEVAAVCISNGAQLIYSMLYLLLIYNLSLISMEWDWGRLEKERRRLRCTIVRSGNFDESYLMQLPKRILVPTMLCSVVMHWLLGLAILAEEAIVFDGEREWSTYTVVSVPSAVWASSALLLSITSVCWWAFTYRREGFIPQMYGSIRTLCASTTSLEWFPASGIQWGDLGERDGFRHAGFSSKSVDKIIPNEIYT